MTERPPDLGRGVGDIPRRRYAGGDWLAGSQRTAGLSSSRFEVLRCVECTGLGVGCMVRSFGQPDLPPSSPEGGPHGGGGASGGVVQVDVAVTAASIEALGELVRVTVESAVRAGFLDALNDPDGPYPDLP